jgi:hypothetical protein
MEFELGDRHAGPLEIFWRPQRTLNLSATRRLKLYKIVMEQAS